MHSYKTNNNTHAKDMTDDEALQYAETHNIGAEPTADAQLVGEASAGAHLDADADGEPDKEPTPPLKTPKSKSASRKPKAGKETASATAQDATAPPQASIVPAAKEKEKKDTPSGGKRKRASRKDEVVASPDAPEELAVETPKSAPKPRKKKAKADA